MSWRLISKIGVAPIVEIWVYTKSHGVRYEISYSYYFDAKGNKHQFGNILLQTRKKEYEFDNLKQLNKFLQKRKIPTINL